MVGSAKFQSSSKWTIFIKPLFIECVSILGVAVQSEYKLSDFKHQKIKFFIREARSLKTRCCRAVFAPRGLRISGAPCLLQLPSGSSGSLACGHISLYLCLDGWVPSPFCLSHIRICMIARVTHLANLCSPSQEHTFNTYFAIQGNIPGTETRIWHYFFSLRISLSLVIAYQILSLI